MSVRRDLLLRFLLLYGMLCCSFGLSSPFLPAFLAARGIGPEWLGVVLGNVSSLSHDSPAHRRCASAHHCGYCPEQPRRFGAGVLWDRRNWRCNGPVDHTFRLAVRALGTCRVLGNGFTMLRSVSHHLELARCAFTKSQSLDDHIILIGTSLTLLMPELPLASARGFTPKSRGLPEIHGLGVLAIVNVCSPASLALWAFVACGRCRQTSLGYSGRRDFDSQRSLKPADRAAISAEGARYRQLGFARCKPL